MAEKTGHKMNLTHMINNFRTKKLAIHVNAYESVRVPYQTNTTFGEALKLLEREVQVELGTSKYQLQYFSENGTLHNVNLNDNIKNSKIKECTLSPSFNRVLAERHRVFGVPLRETVAKGSKDGIPNIVVRCAEFILQRGINIVGILRLSGSLTKINEMKKLFDEGVAVEFSTEAESEIHNVSSLLKMYLKQLPEPLCTFEKYLEFVEVTLTSNEVEEQVAKLRFLVHSLPTNNYRLLKYVMEFARTISKNAEVNKMDVNNCAIVLAPNLFRGQELSLETLSAHNPLYLKTTALLINNIDKIFDKAFDESPRGGSVVSVVSITKSDTSESLLDSPSDDTDVLGLVKKEQVATQLAHFWEDKYKKELAKSQDLQEISAKEKKELQEEISSITTQRDSHAREIEEYQSQLTSLTEDYKRNLAMMSQKSDKESVVRGAEAENGQVDMAVGEHEQAQQEAEQAPTQTQSQSQAQDQNEIQNILLFVEGQYEKTISKLRSEVAQLKRAVDTTKSEMAAKATEQAKESRAELKKLQCAVMQLNIKKSKLKEKLRIERLMYEKTEQVTGLAKEEAAKAKQKLQAAQDKLSHLEAEISGYKSTISSQEKDIDTIRTEKDLMRRQVETSSAKIASVEGSRATLEKKLEQVISQHQKLSADVEQAQQDNKEATARHEAERAKWESEKSDIISSNARECESLGLMLEEQNSARERLDNKMLFLSQEKNNLQEQLKTQVTLNQQKDEEASKLHLIIEDLKAQLAHQRAQLTVATQDTQTQEKLAQAAAVRNKMATMAQVNMELEKRCQTLSSEFRHFAELMDRFGLNATVPTTTPTAITTTITSTKEGGVDHNNNTSSSSSANVLELEK